MQKHPAHKKEESVQSLLGETELIREEVKIL